MFLRFSRFRVCSWIWRRPLYPLFLLRTFRADDAIVGRLVGGACYQQPIIVDQVGQFGAFGSAGLGAVLRRQHHFGLGRAQHNLLILGIELGMVAGAVAVGVLGRLQDLHGTV